jgi:lysyl-tRNA synthetase class 2
MPLEVTATRSALKRRAAMLAEIRRFFAGRGVLEVETPALSSAAVSDPTIHSLGASAPQLGWPELYLHTSPEFAMKRLLAAGIGDIYQICRVFRDGELGRWHQPEFTLLEWYRLDFDDAALMQELAALLRELIPARLSGPTQQLTFAAAFEAALGLGPETPSQLIATALAARGIDAPAGLSHPALIDLAFGTVVARALDPDALTFITDFPLEQAALARLKPGNPPRAARFEAFCGGLELANGFAELTDAREQHRRFEAELAERRRQGLPCAPLDREFLAALEAGLPPCAGVAVGLDRVVALALGINEIASGMSLAHTLPAYTLDATGPGLAMQLTDLLATEPRLESNAANFVAWLYQSLAHVNWVGIYWLRDGELALGPFQGAPAITRIALGEGVCGLAASRRETLNVPDVHAFDGHIVCDPRSRSELVIPLLAAGRLLGVLDIDSPQPARFSTRDAADIGALAEQLLLRSAPASLLDA